MRGKDQDGGGSAGGGALYGSIGAVQFITGDECHQAHYLEGEKGGEGSEGDGARIARCSRWTGASNGVGSFYEGKKSRISQLAEFSNQYKTRYGPFSQICAHMKMVVCREPLVYPQKGPRASLSENQSTPRYRTYPWDIMHLLENQNTVCD